MTDIRTHKKTIAPYGSWASPITSDMPVAESLRAGWLVTLDGDDVYWIEGRPAEEGRSVIVRYTSDGQKLDVTPQPFNARTLVHEYGGGDYVVSNGIVYFANFADQCLYRQVPGSQPVPMTAESQARYADMVVDQQRRRLICVCEDHTNTEREPITTIGTVPLDGDAQTMLKVLISGNDFYAAPRLSPNGKQLAWLTWNHPNMPWDDSELWVADLDELGSISNAQRVAGGVEEAVFQPLWSPDNILYFISDRSNWSNLYRWHNHHVEPLHPLEAEFTTLPWLFGFSSYGFTSAEQIVCWYAGPTETDLAFLNTRTGELNPISIPYTLVDRVYADAKQVVFVGSTPTSANELARLDVATGAVEVLWRTRSADISAEYISVPQLIEFPTENNLTAYAYFYPPQNADFQAPEGELPPLRVIVHGGPTTHAVSALNFGIQYWTSRGIAIVDVNYGGSSGFGRAYRNRLRGQWGIVDLDDSVNVARYLVERGLVDENRLVIQGRSAGGYTTLNALAFRDTFKAGASYYGISDLTTFMHEPHKFESRYFYGLIGPYPERKDLYDARSAINFLDQITRPAIIIQGLEDKVVLPDQAELMVDALRAKKLPVAYLAYEGEQHGFRRAKNIKRSQEAELYFYAKVFNFALADEIEPVEIENLQ